MRLIQYWDDPLIPDNVANHRRTWAEGPDGFDCLIFSRRTARDFLAEQFSAREVAAFDACALPAMQSDYFRYCAVYALGGLYIDATWRQLASLRPIMRQLASENATGCVFARDWYDQNDADDPLLDALYRLGWDRVLNAMFCCPEPGHAMLLHTIELTTRNIEHRLANEVGWVTGSFLFILFANLRRCSSMAALQSVFDALIAAEPKVDPFIRVPLDYVSEVGMEALQAAAARVFVLSGSSAADFFRRPPEEHVRGPSHWTRHTGSIFCTEAPAPLPSLPR